MLILSMHVDESTLIRVPPEMTADGETLEIRVMVTRIQAAKESARIGFAADHRVQIVRDNAKCKEPR